MARAGLLALLLVVTASPTVAADLEAMVAALTAPELAGRGAGTAEESRAADLVGAWLAAAGCQPAFAGQWTREFPLPDGGVSRNVAGMLVGAGDLADRWLVVGAHIDHLGRLEAGGEGTPAVGEYYPGAGDNASGVAAMVSAVRGFASAPDQPRRSLLVCGFGAEEIGLLGSAALAADLPIPAARIDAMINLDAVGRLGDGPLNVAGLETSGRFADLVAAAAGGVAVRSQDTSLLQSDHLNFLALEIPAVFLFTGGYAEMNSPADDLAHLDLAGLATVAAITEALLRAVATDPGLFGFQEPPPVVERPDSGTGNRQTWFGSVPDFAGEQTAGYVIGGVADGGPAARAGLRKGDVMVMLGGQAVVDLPTFTTALRQHDPGDVVEVEVVRDGRRLRSLVTLGDRSERGR